MSTDPKILNVARRLSTSQNRNREHLAKIVNDAFPGVGDSFDFNNVGRGFDSYCRALQNALQEPATTMTDQPHQGLFRSGGFFS